MPMNQLEQLFAEIATAIRYKLGTSATIVADDFPDEIAKIQTGSTVPEYDWSYAKYAILNHLEIGNIKRLEVIYD